MLIYLITSLKNDKLPTLSTILRQNGFSVFDDWYSPGPDADDFWTQHYKRKGLNFKQALNGPHAWNVFRFDKENIDKSDVVVLVQPCGKSAHIELGYAIGRGKPAFVLLDKEPERFDIMYRFCTNVCYNVNELIDELKLIEDKLRST